jgi:hypothetical protein
MPLGMRVIQMEAQAEMNSAAPTRASFGGAPRQGLAADAVGIGGRGVSDTILSPRCDSRSVKRRSFS